MWLGITQAIQDQTKIKSAPQSLVRLLKCSLTQKYKEKAAAEREDRRVQIPALPLISYVILAYSGEFFWPQFFHM
jgi:hypothetical protein